MFGIEKLQRTLYTEVVHTAFSAEFVPGGIFILLGSNWIYSTPPGLPASFPDYWQTLVSGEKVWYSSWWRKRKTKDSAPSGRALIGCEICKCCFTLLASLLWNSYLNFAFVLWTTTDFSLLRSLGCRGLDKLTERFCSRDNLRNIAMSSIKIISESQQYVQHISHRTRFWASWPQK